MLGAITGLNVVAWGLFVLVILPHQFRYTALGVGVGVGVTAWTLGARHAFDADHIAAIDNSTRKLMADGKRPLGTGFFFALGHSTVLLVAGVAITLAARPVFHAVVRPTSTFETAGGTIGTLVSAGFLWLIASLNLVVLGGIVGVFRELRRGRYNETQLEAQLQERGLMYRFFGRWMRTIKSSWQMFPVGFVFGIGFDTATEVLLLAGTAAAATQGLPWYAVLALPLLFAGGMTLFDSFDGFFMNTAYGWAFAKPVRKVYYNIVITTLSVVVAFVIGGIEISGVLSTKLHLRGWFATTMASFDLNRAGFIVVGLFVVVWVLAMAIWKVGKVEAKWERRLRDPPVSDSYAGRSMPLEQLAELLLPHVMKQAPAYSRARPE
jgi:high-affinity nickel-transport protein